MLNVNAYPATPDSEVFSTPPTSPMPPITLTNSGFVDAAGSVDPGSSTSTRRGGRPQNLLLDHSKAASGVVNPNIHLLKSSPLSNQFSQSIPDITEQTVIKPSPSTMSISEQALKSPCFVHSQLEKGVSLTDWLRHAQLSGSGANLKSGGSSISEFDSPSTAVNDEEYDEQFSRSLTRQLAETAVGVREMSKALGRARVHSEINSILVITKARDNRLVKLTRELAIYLMQKKYSKSSRRLIVYVDSQLQYSKRFDVEGIQQEHPEFFVPVPKRRSSSSSLVSGQSTNGNGGETVDEGQLRFWTSDMCTRSPHLFDFVVTLGGDGTVLFTSWLFQKIVPPVLPFALGSLGFLTNFDFNDHKAVMDAAIDSGIRVNLRMRFTCTVYRAIAPEHCTKKRKAVKKAETGEILMKDIEKGGWEALESGFTGTGTHGKKDKEIMCFTTRPVESFEILNDLVVDRGPSPYVSLLELFGDEHHMTTVQADGLVVATPTGSTAYSLSAGGSLVHPEIPAILISPICPHTLSFRPMLLPDTMELRICVPYNSRSTAWASFDGRGRVELKQGDHIKVTASKYPFPTVCADKQSTDWFHAISRTLKWNERERQKSFVMVEEPGVKTPSSRRATTGPGVDAANKGSPLEKHVEEKEDGEEDKDEESDDEEDEDEEEETFDIDDSSTTQPASAVPSNTPSRSQSGTNTPARIRVEKAELSMTSIPVNAPESPVVSLHINHQDQDQQQAQTAAEESKDLNHHDDGERDNIYSPKSLLHGSKSKIPRDRDVESMLTPRAIDHDQTPSVSPSSHQHHTRTHHTHHQVPGRHQHHHNHQFPLPHHIQLANVINPLQQARFALASARPRGHHRPSRSDDFGTGGRAFAVWGQDESDSNTDSEH